jgi:hypothetical protein
MGNETTVRLRDQRKPGHGWFDNEIYDVFGDELRQDGLSVYMTLARLCYGVTVRMSLREMAAHARMSKDTFARNLRRVVALGLVIERKGATPQSASAYELVDVKELAVRYMREAVDAEKQAAAQSVSPRDTRPATTLAQLISVAIAERAEVDAEQSTNCLTQRQNAVAADSVDKKICEGVVATDVSQNDPCFETEVSQAVRHVRQDTRLKTQDNYKSPLPPASGGTTVSVADRVGSESDERDLRVEDLGESERAAVREAEDAEKRAAQRVMLRCGIANDRAVKLIARAVGLGASKADYDGLSHAESVAQCADAMIAAYALYRELGPRLRYRWGPVKFFCEDHWNQSETWPYLPEIAERMARSSHF